MTVYHRYTPQFVYGIPVTRFLFLQSGVGLKFLPITLIFSGRSVQIQMPQNCDLEIDRHVDFYCNGILWTYLWRIAWGYSDQQPLEFNYGMLIDAIRHRFHQSQV